MPPIGATTWPAWSEWLCASERAAIRRRLEDRNATDRAGGDRAAVATARAWARACASVVQGNHGEERGNVREGWELQEICCLTCGRRASGHNIGVDTCYIDCGRSKCITGEWISKHKCINDCKKNLSCDEAKRLSIHCWRRSKAKGEANDD